LFLNGQCTEALCLRLANGERAIADSKNLGVIGDRVALTGGGEFQAGNGRVA
jgi:hypothetical protein